MTSNYCEDWKLLQIAVILSSFYNILYRKVFLNKKNASSWTFFLNNSF